MKRTALFFAVLAPALACADGILFPPFHHEPDKADLEVPAYATPIAAQIDSPLAKARADFTLDSSVDAAKRIYVCRAAHYGVIALTDLTPVAILSSDEFSTTASMKEQAFLKSGKEQFLFLFKGEEKEDRGEMFRVSPPYQGSSYPLKAGNVLVLTPGPDLEPVYSF